MTTGQCKCGGLIHESNHEVKTERGIDGYGITCDLPAQIETSTCSSCGRCKIVVRDALGKIVLTKG